MDIKELKEVSKGLFINPENIAAAKRYFELIGITDAESEVSRIISHAKDDLDTQGYIATIATNTYIVVGTVFGGDMCAVLTVYIRPEEADAVFGLSEKYVGVCRIEEEAHIMQSNAQ